MTKLICKKEVSRYNEFEKTTTIFYRVGDIYNYDGSPAFNLLGVGNNKVECMVMTREKLFEYFQSPADYRDAQIDSILS